MLLAKRICGFPKSREVERIDGPGKTCRGLPDRHGADSPASWAG